MSSLRKIVWFAAAMVVALTYARVAAQAPVASPPTKQAAVNGVSLTYVEQGHGSPVVFVHGAIADHRIWEAQREPVADRYHYIALTQRYFGTSPWPDSGEKYSLATHADDLAAFIRYLQVGPVHVVGWSYGASIQLALAVQHPELIKSMFVFEGGFGTSVTDPVKTKAVADDRKDMVTPAVTATKAGDLAGAVRVFVDAVNSQPGTFEGLSPASRSVILDNARTLPLHFAAPPPPQIGCPQLGQIKSRVAIVRGEETRPIFRILSDTASRCIRGSQLIIIPKARHLAPADATPAFNEALLTFLKDK